MWKRILFCAGLVTATALVTAAVSYKIWRPAWERPFQFSAPFSGTPTGVRPQVGAYYYAWYDRGKWELEAVTHKPLLGFYFSARKETARRHVRWAKDAGLNFFVLSWLGRDHYQTRTVFPLLFHEGERQGLQMVILYDTAIAVHQHPDVVDFGGKLPDGGLSGDLFVRDLVFLADELATHPAYMRLEGCPVVLVYLVRNLKNQDRFFEQLRNTLAAKGKCLRLIADVVWWGRSGAPLVQDPRPPEQQWAWLKKEFFGVTGYNMFSAWVGDYGFPPERARVFPGTRFLSVVEKEYEAWSANAAAADLLFMPNVMPGFDDRPLRGGARPLVHRSLDFYRRYWSIAAGLVKSPQQMLFLTSFNEWHEGTELEPSLEDGYRYLKETRELIGKLGEAAKAP